MVSAGHRGRVGNHWSAALADDISTALVGTLLSDPLRPNRHLRAVTAVAMSAGLALQVVDETHTFIPWTSVDTLVVEGVNQVRDRPSVGAVVAFGVLGLAARRQESEAYVVVDTADGAWVLEIAKSVPAKIRADLSPFLRAIDATSAASAEPEDVFETIRRLGALRDEGLISQDEFEAKKAELLDRL